MLHSVCACVSVCEKKVRRMLLDLRQKFGCAAVKLKLAADHVDVTAWTCTDPPSDLTILGTVSMDNPKHFLVQ